MFRSIILILCLVFLISCSRTYSPALYPVSISRTIKFFAKTFNNIGDKESFAQLEDILLSEAFAEFQKLKEVLYKEKATTLLKRQRKAYIDYAKELSIEITKIEQKSDSEALVYVLFFNKKTLEEEKKVLRMQIDDRIWKISKISNYSD